jgi:hypothetical protein
MATGAAGCRGCTVHRAQDWATEEGDTVKTNVVLIAGTWRGIVFHAKRKTSKSPVIITLPDVTDEQWIGMLMEVMRDDTTRIADMKTVDTE